MKRFKVAFAILLIVTLAFIGFTAYCFDRAVVHAPKKPEPYQDEDGIWHDPTLKQWEAYSKAKEALKPYRIFLQYSPIGFTLITASWLILGIEWMKREKKKSRETHTNLTFPIQHVNTSCQMPYVDFVKSQWKTKFLETKTKLKQCCFCQTNLTKLDNLNLPYDAW